MQPITAIKYRTVLLSPQILLCLFLVNTPHDLEPLKTTTDLFSISIILPVLEYHRNSIIQYVAFCV